MKKLTPILILSLLFLSIGFSQQEYNINDLVEMDNGLWTIKFSDEPITGKMFGFFGENKPYKKVYMGNLRNGKKEGKWVSYYHSTGRKMYEQNFKDGKQDRLSKDWYENGQKRTEHSFKDGKEDGLATQWYENGQMRNEVNYKDGKEDGLATQWYENGQMRSEVNYKDGKEDGLVTQWYENGQKKSKVTYKDGEQISKKEWNEDGSVKE
jgi:antitoxin component YwqK of YwqJK toxin-antitoxin module